MGTMEVDRVLRLIQLLSDKCSFKGVELSVTATQLKEELKTVQRVGGRLSELASLAEGLFVQGALEEGSQNCTGGEVLASLDGNSTGAWFSIQMGDSKFQNLEGVGVAFGILCTVLFLPLIISCLVQLAQKRRISQIAQANFRLLGTLAETSLGLLALFSNLKGMRAPPDLATMIQVMTDPKEVQARGHMENEIVRSYGLFLTSLHERFRIMDSHAQVLAKNLDSLKLAIYTFARVHQGLVEGTGADFVRGQSLMLSVVGDLRSMMPAEEWEKLRKRLHQYEVSNYGGDSAGSSPWGSDFNATDPSDKGLIAATPSGSVAHIYSTVDDDKPNMDDSNNVTTKL